MKSKTHQRITKSIVDRLGPGETIRDTELKGFGVRRQQGGPFYFLQKKIHGQNRWYSIGQHGSPWTPETARRRAFELLRDLSTGADPKTKQRAERAIPTVADAVDAFLVDHGPHLKSVTRSEYERLLRQHVIPALGRRRVSEVAKAEVSKLHNSLSTTAATANFTLAVLSKLLAWCEERGFRPANANPCRGIRKFRQTKRERYLSAQEFERLGHVLMACEGQESPFVLTAIRLLIFTGARLNEILTLQWAHVRLDLGLLLLPDSKTGQKAIRLNSAASELLASLPRVGNNPYVITGHRQGAHLVNLQKPWRRIREMAELRDVRLHDLRHSFASVAAASGASLPMIGALLGHSQPQTTARYAHLASDPLQRLNQDVGNAIAEAMAPKV